MFEAFLGRWTLDLGVLDFHCPDGRGFWILDFGSSNEGLTDLGMPDGGNWIVVLGEGGHCVIWDCGFTSFLTSRDLTLSARRSPYPLGDRATIKVAPPTPHSRSEDPKIQDPEEPCGFWRNRSKYSRPEFWILDFGSWNDMTCPIWLYALFFPSKEAKVHSSDTRRQLWMKEHMSKWLSTWRSKIHRTESAEGLDD